MAFDPIAEGAVEVFDPIAEGAVAVEPTAGEPLEAEQAFERAGKVWDASVDLDVPLYVAEQYFYDAKIQDPSDLNAPVPDNRVGFSEEFINQWTGKNAVTKIPIVGGLIGLQQNISVITAANRLIDPAFDYDKYNTGQSMVARRSGGIGFGGGGIGIPDRPHVILSSASRDRDKKMIAKAFKDFEFQSRGKTFGGKVAAGLSQLPTWMAEFAATGGLASLGDDVARKAGEKLLRQYVKTTAGKVAIKSAGLVTGAVIRTSTGLLPRVGEKATARQALVEIGVAEEEGWAMSLAKAWGDTAIEALSEETGALLTKGAGALIGRAPFASKFIPRLQERWIALTGGTVDDFTAKIATKVGYSSILGEIGEERIATLLREVTGVSDRPGKMGERIWEGMKEDFTLENLGAEFVTLLAPASVRRGMTMGMSLTKGVSVPAEAEQLNMAIKVGKVRFDTPEDAKGYAEKAAEVAQREGIDVTINTDLTGNSVTLEKIEPEAIKKDAAEVAPKVKKIIPPTVKEKQALPDNESVTPVEKAILGEEPIAKIMESLEKAKAVQPTVKAEQKAELKRRVGAAAGALRSNVKKGTPTDEAIFKSTGLLKGQLTDYEQRFESIEDDLSAEDKNAAYEKIRTHPDLKYFEVVNTATSFRKLTIGTTLTDGDVKNIERVFGKTFSDITDERLEVSGVLDKAIALWKAGLLTGIKTSGLNTLSNMSHAVTETAKDVPAVLVDKTAALFTGKRTLAFTTKGTKEGVKKGLIDGWKYLRTGHSERDIGKKLDHTKVNFGTGKIARGLQAYEETIFHLLGAEDQPFYYGAKARSIASQAIAQGKTKKLKGKELDTFVENLMKSPMDDMLEAAVHDAEVAVFQNRTALGDIAKSIQKTKVGQIVVPFGRTPSAVATQIIHYTPLGAVNEVVKQIAKGEFNQRQFSQAFGRAAVGTGVLYIGGKLLEAGLMTLDRPRNEKERRLWELEGRKANSIKVGGKWRSVQVLGPAGNVLIIGGHFKNELSKEGSPTKAIVKAMTGSAKSFSEQTFVQGVNKAVDALVSPERSFENWFSSMAGSVVPTIVADIARASTEKEVRVDGAIQRIQSRVPGLRGKLPPKIDVFGQDLPRYGGNVLEVMIDPTRPAKIRNDVVVDEIRRLADNDLEVAPTLLGGKGGFDILTDEENTELWRRAGELTYKTLQALVTSDGYANVTNDFAKSKMLEEVIRKTRATARAEVAVIKLTEGFGIVELAESGLLSVEEIEAIKFFGAQ